MPNEKEIVKKILENLDKKRKQGIRAHGKHIPYEEGMKSEVKLYPWRVLDAIMELKSEPFSSEREANHFAAVFRDNFLYDPTVVHEGGKYYVYTGWLLKDGFNSYGLNQKFQHYVFVNWS